MNQSERDVSRADSGALGSIDGDMAQLVILLVVKGSKARWRTV